MNLITVQQLYKCHNNYAIDGVPKFRPTPLDGAHEIAGILCSSGTTGLSKGIHNANLSLLDAFNILWFLRPIVKRCQCVTRSIAHNAGKLRIRAIA